MKDTFHFLYVQFSNLFDSNKALAVFLISLALGLICTFIGGRRYERHKINKIQANQVQENIYQTVRNGADKQKMRNGRMVQRRIRLRYKRYGIEEDSYKGESSKCKA